MSKTQTEAAPVPFALASETQAEQRRGSQAAQLRQLVGRFKV